MRTLKQKNFKKLLTGLLSAVILVQLLLPVTAFSEEKEQKTVRVGWFDSSFCYYDQFGRRCGVDYEYHQKISAYTGWTYEYVEDSWPNLLQKLKSGEIDLLSDVSYKPEREEFLFYSDLPMGTEAYYIYIGSDNRTIKADDLSTFNGKRIGVNKDSFQESLLKDWADRNGIHPKIIELTNTQDDSMDQLNSGKLDGLASIFTFDYNRDVQAVCRIGGSDYYYAVSKKRPDLLEELNLAMAEIHDSDPYFNEKISQNRLYSSRATAMLTPAQEDWLSQHGEIRIGYREDYLPFCDTDEQTGELTGALKDYLAHAVNNLNNPLLQFTPVPYESTEAALEALEAGEVDCVFPVCLHTYDAEQRGLVMTDPAMETEMNAIMRTGERQNLSDDSTITFAVRAQTVNMNTLIMDSYPNAIRKEYQDLEACYDAVAKGEADCVLVSNYRVPSEEDTLRKKGLYTVPAGNTLPFSFAVRNTDGLLFAILNKTVLTVRKSEMNAVMTSYLYANQKVSVIRFLKDHWLTFLGVLTFVFAIILFLLLQKLRAERLANRQRHLLEEAAQIAELQQTVTSLLDNTPGIYFTKDANTGKYLACNQMFADYLHKPDPAAVIGLTAADVFDADIAAHFAEDDKTALSMDEPLTYYDTMEGLDGQMVNVKVTRQKYTDANGQRTALPAGSFPGCFGQLPHLQRQGIEQGIL